MLSVPPRSFVRSFFTSQTITNFIHGISSVIAFHRDRFIWCVCAYLYVALTRILFNWAPPSVRSCVVKGKVMPKTNSIPLPSQFISINVIYLSRAYFYAFKFMVFGICLSCFFICSFSPPSFYLFVIHSLFVIVFIISSLSLYPYLSTYLNPSCFFPLSLPMSSFILSLSLSLL